MYRFLSTLPARGATAVHRQLQGAGRISIHAPREGSDGHGADLRRAAGHFYPRSPRGERRRPKRGRWPPRPHFYPRSPRGERQYSRFVEMHLYEFLSTLPARGATPERGPSSSGEPISIHAPREGSDSFRVVMFAKSRLFLSTLPARGATPDKLVLTVVSEHFYPRSPRGERHVYGESLPFGLLFLSTLPARGATRCRRSASGPPRPISIHAPREGSDASKAGMPPVEGAFLSTLPARGATFPGPTRAPCGSIFLSTLPARGATTLSQEIDTYEDLFLSTLPARGATRSVITPDSKTAHFYPRSPRGERRCRSFQTGEPRYFYPRSPRGERRRPAASLWPGRTDFYPRSPRGERPQRSGSQSRCTADFYPRSPRGERHPGWPWWPA